MGIRTIDVACLAGLLALALGGGLAGVRSARTKAESVDRQNKAVEVRLAELKQARSVLGVFDRALRSNQTSLEALRERLPQSRGIGDFLADMDRLMTRNKVSLSNVTPGAPVAEELCTRRPLNFSCRGTFANLHAVLYGLERMSRLVRVDQVSISRDSLSSDCEMNASCSVYGR